MWFDFLTIDPAYMQAVLSVSQVYVFLRSDREHILAARRATLHQSAAVKLLRERLALDSFKISDSTILVVYFLAGYAYFMNEYDIAKHHMEGLRKMIDLRGGIFAFRHNTKLIIELLKYVE